MAYFLTTVAEHMIDARIIAIGLHGGYGKFLSAAKVNQAWARAYDREQLVHYLPHISFCVDWDKLMANTRNDFNLIDYRLSDAELDQFDAWLQKKAPTPTDCLIYLAEKNYKVSLTYVETSQAWCVTVTGKEDAKFNAKTSMTSWGDEPLETLYMAAFKVMEIFGGGVWKTKQQSRRG